MLHIRNMESSRCKTVVKTELHKLGLHYKTVDFGQFELKENISLEKWQSIDAALRNAGLQLMNDKKSLLIEKIKAAIYQLIYLADDIPKVKISQYISKKVNHDYSSLSNLFSGMQGITIEKYLIEQKIERVKELMVYGKMSLTDIAFKMQYSSVAHLSNQFRKVTGLTPSIFRQLRSIPQQNPNK